MSTVFCLKLKKESPALAQAPYPGALGQKILTQISQEAWKLWLTEQTKLINELRLNLSDSKARSTLEEHMIAFLFGSSAQGD